MLRFHSRLFPSPLRCQEDNELCAITRSAIVDFQTGTVVGVLVMLPGFFPRKSIALMHDITAWDELLTINSHESLTDGADVVRLEHVLSTRYTILALPVRTEKGESIGIVLDYIFDDVSGEIVKYFVGRTRWFGAPEATYCITKDEVIQLTTDALIVKDRIRPLLDREPIIEPGFTPEPAA